jgi:hypothetical protein
MKKTITREHEQGAHVNDRKLEMWTLQKIGKSEYNPDKIQVQVYAVPKKQARGAETEFLKIVINGIVVKDTDIYVGVHFHGMEWGGATTEEEETSHVPPSEYIKQLQVLGYYL